MNSLKNFKNIGLFFTSPNADPDNYIVTAMINKFIKKKSKCTFLSKPGKRKYVSLLKYSNIILGNSSSGILEAPYLGTYTINIGDRQLGRLKSKTVYDVENNENKIRAIVSKLILRKKQKNIKYMYGSGNASKKIVDIIKHIDFKKLI